MEGRVALVAGGGRGIGRATALMLAAEGAAVAIADPGVTTDGVGVSEANLAESVAAEIAGAGGRAVGWPTAIGDLATGEELIQKCLDSFGRVDAVLIPAAILRDRMVFNMTEEEWYDVIRVCLSGVFGLVRPATILMRSQRYGRIVTFTSGAALEGRAGTANYSAAKMGVVGLTKTVAKDMAKYGVLVNCIAPRADTRLSQTVAAALPSFAPGVDPSQLADPSEIAALATYLASDRCTVTGKVFWCSRGHLGLYPEFMPQTLYLGESAVDLGVVSKTVEEYAMTAGALQ